eukprot:g3303.t1
MQEASAKAFFNEPVDPEALGIPEYPLVIKQPMDLGLIFWKLKDHNYKYVKHFFEDLNLVWSNCQEFNLKGSAVYVASEKLDALFQKLWTRSKKSLKLDEDDRSLGIAPRTVTNTSDGAEGSKRKRGALQETESRKASVSPTPHQDKKQNSKLKIRLGKNQKKDPEASTGASASNSRLEKDSDLNVHTRENLETCIGILHRLLTCSDAVALIHAPIGGTFMSLSEILASLASAKERNWKASQFSSSKDVLHEAQLFLKNQAVKNEHKRKTVKACNDLLTQLEEAWSSAGLIEDLKGLKLRSGDSVQDSGALPESNLRITKARVEKLKRQQMEKEVKEAQDAILKLESLKKVVEETKVEAEQFREKTREEIRELETQYKAKLAQLEDLSRQKHQVQRRKERALAAITSAQVRSHSFVFILIKFYLDCNKSIKRKRRESEEFEK